MQNPYAVQIAEQVEDRSVTGGAFRLLLGQFVESIKGCLRKEADNAIEILAPTLASRNLSRASMVSVICGSMVDSGCDPSVVAQPMAIGLAKALKTALPIAQKLEAKLRPKLIALDDPDKDPQRIASAIHQLSVRMPEAAAGFKALDRFFIPAISVYSKDIAGREVALPKIWDNASLIEPWHSGVHRLMKVLSVLEKEPLVMIDVAHRKGFVGHFGGVVTNSQMLILLMDTFAHQDVFYKPLVSHDLVQCAKGEGPCKVEDSVNGAWNVYSYQALSSIEKLPDPKDLKANKFWIWNEKTPADVPVVDGHRIILIGPPSFPRNWKFTRDFKHLKAGIVVDSDLSKSELKIWIDKIIARNASLKSATAESL